jgi:hypothetical protein
VGLAQKQPRHSEFGINPLSNTDKIHKKRHSFANGASLFIIAYAAR